MKAPRSLQARVLALALAALALIWLVAAAMIWIDTRHELDELLDGHLAQAAALLVVHQTQAEGDEDAPADAHSPYKYAPRVAFQVFHQGVLTLRSANAPLEPLSLKTQGFDTVRDPQGQSWRILASPGAEPDVRVVVAERMEARHAILGALARSVLLPLGLALPALALALWWSVRQGLRPLHALRQTLEQRRPEALTPVESAALPQEMQPLVQALNALCSAWPTC
jgi:two-component system sensor histidine kinase QseC